MMLKDQVYNKTRDLAFHTVVNKVFLGALPISESEMTRENTLAISTYSLKALESAGGFGLLEKAIENTTDPYKLNFLTEIKEVCESAAMTVANRVAMEDAGDDSSSDDSSSDNNDSNDNNDSSDDKSDSEDSGAEPRFDDEKVKEDSDEKTSIDDIKAPDDTKPVPLKPEIIRHGIPYQKLKADAKMTDKEYANFVESMGKLDLPEISKKINERVEVALKAEKETYKMIDEADQRLKDAITDKAEDEGDSLTDSQAEEVKESMLSVPLKGKQRSHMSLFSKLQASAFEAVQLEGYTDYDNISADILLGVTENFTIPGIFGHTEPTVEQAINSALNYTLYQEANECVNPRDAMVIGNAVATIVYTLLQTMHSMNLVRITPLMVKQCCVSRGPFEARRVNPMDDFDVRVRAALEKNNKQVSGTRYTTDVESAIENLNRIRSKVYTARDHGLPVKESTIRAIEASINMALKKKSSLDAAMESVVSPGMYGTSPRYFETDVCSMNRLMNTFRNTPVDAIEFACKEGATRINVVGLLNGKNIKNSTIVLENAVDVPTASYLKALVIQSKLPTMSFGTVHPTITTNIDGRRNRIS